MFQKWWKKDGEFGEGVARSTSPQEGRKHPDLELFSVQFPVENKMFYVDLKQNSNGTYLKISEKSGGRRHNVLIPLAGLQQLREALDQALAVVQQQDTPPSP